MEIFKKYRCISCGHIWGTPTNKIICPKCGKVESVVPYEIKKYK